MPHMAERILITGKPGSGKSTVARDIIRELDIKAGGISTPEIRGEHGRTGFMIRDIYTGNEEIMASVDIKTKPKVGKYGVDLKALDDIGVSAIDEAIENPQIEFIVIDELGAMELCSRNFEMAVEAAFSTDKDMLAILHRNYVDKYGQMGRVFTLTRDNAEQIKREIIGILK